MNIEACRVGRSPTRNETENMEGRAPSPGEITENVEGRAPSPGKTENMEGRAPSPG